MKNIKTEGGSGSEATKSTMVHPRAGGGMAKQDQVYPKFDYYGKVL